MQAGSWTLLLGPRPARFGGGEGACSGASASSCGVVSHSVTAATGFEPLHIWEFRLPGATQSGTPRASLSAAFGLLALVGAPQGRRSRRFRRRVRCGMRAVAEPDGDKGGIAMISPDRKKRMEEQGWKVVGTHSATKLCRWTKNMLQGKGGCYKHTFYGIASHRCMEHTPNVSCANKCVFCWRNHINPVALDWKFETDDPEQIIEESLRRHYQTIEEQCQSPHAIEERKAEARQVRHCAISLVGEPVAYPRIAEYLAGLHRRRISSFLVTNGQHPAALRQMPAATQIYVSCDAFDKDNLEKVGRPLFPDFWERYLESLDVLRTRPERTVCRLTLIRKVSMIRPDAWAKLLLRASPDFVELKAVTITALFDQVGMSLDNMPPFPELKAFAEELVSLMPGYGLACEHHHSNGVLVASERFRDRSTGAWRTWIDFDGFADRWAAGDLIDAMDYTLPTPEWALYDSPNRGFAPTETRKIKRKAARAQYPSDGSPSGDGRS